GSAMRWSDMAAESGLGLRSTVLSVPTPDLGRRLDRITGSYPSTVIDTPPGHGRIVSAAVAMSDLVVVPCQPGLADLDRIWPTLELIDEAGRTGLVVLNRIRTGTTSLSSTLDALDEAGVPVAESLVPQREAISTTYGYRPGVALVRVGDELLDELESYVKPRRRRRAS
ncbi:MAG: hypothetical protein ACRD1G_18555, partial [Acidimicrobiales bacterium]